MASEVHQLALYEMQVSAKTTWVFMRVTTAEGVSGVGEVTFFGHEDGLLQQARVLARAVKGLPTTQREAFLRDRAGREADRCAQILLAGLDQALTDIRARELGVPAVDLLGGQRSAAFASYANINRGTTDRSPDAHAARALAAVGAGYDAIKVAPFDGVMAAEMGRIGTDALIQAGIDRVAAIRDAVGPDVRINVDCHSRFNETGARAAITALAPHDPFWIEELIPETETQNPAARRLRSFANERGIRLAGAENGCSIEAYRGILNAGFLDVILPDIRYCGGVAEALRIAHLVVGAGIEFSLHNPVGPVLDAVSRQVAACAPGMVMLERTFLESPEQAAATDPTMPDPDAAGYFQFDRPGWGVTLGKAVLQRSSAEGGRVASDLQAVAGAGPYAQTY